MLRSSCTALAALRSVAALIPGVGLMHAHSRQLIERDSSGAQVFERYRHALFAAAAPAEKRGKLKDQPAENTC